MSQDFLDGNTAGFTERPPEQEGWIIWYDGEKHHYSPLLERFGATVFMEGLKYLANMIGIKIF